MRFQFSFKHMATSAALQQYAESKLSEKVDRFVTKAVEGHVTFSVDRHLHTAHCSVFGGDGFRLQVEHQSEDMYASIDRLVDKLEAQLKKHKEKLKSHKPKVDKQHRIALVAGDGSEREEAVDATDIIKFEEARQKRLKRA